MAFVTLVGERLAKVGDRFLFLGALEECKDCKLRNVCFNLEEGFSYEIVNVRDKKHDCKVHEECVRVVEVKKRAIPAAIDVKQAFEGAVVNIELQCRNRGCEYYSLCRPYKLSPKVKLKVTKVMHKISCPEGKELVEVELF
ncbi:MAG: UPF0179 family protein [Candidatus Thermoplasmatota archaeon]|nr:UPF0179 family protein [Candidatus Thermoplasmatota archaeon]